MLSSIKLKKLNENITAIYQLFYIADRKITFLWFYMYFRLWNLSNIQFLINIIFKITYILTLKNI